MKILHLSDTHGCHNRLHQLPEADVIVHSGDFTMTGSEQEAIDFLNWFCELDYRHKIFICGNHDDCLYKADITGLDDNVYYLCNTEVEIEGIRFYGIPMFMLDCISRQQGRNYIGIPHGIDVLVTHEPPFGILDLDGDIHYGSKDMLSRLVEVRPRMHLFGHIHSNHGWVKNNGIIYSNGAILDAGYYTLNAPNLLELQ